MKVERRSVIGSEGMRGEGGEGRWVVGKKELRVEAEVEEERVVRFADGCVVVAKGAGRLVMALGGEGEEETR